MSRTIRHDLAPDLPRQRTRRWWKRHLHHVDRIAARRGLRGAL